MTTPHLLGLADRLSAAQVRVYQQQAEVAQARADLAHREAALSEALTDMNSVVTSLLLNATGERLGDVDSSTLPPVEDLAAQHPRTLGRG